MMKINEEEIKKIQEQNREKVSRFLPKSLEQRETKLFDKFLKHKGNSFTKLKALYSFMDELYASIGRFLPCKKGCTFCCYYKVDISELEVQYIEKFANIKRSIKKLYGIPCNLLQNGICSIYPYRPFHCRKCISLYHSSEFCHPDLALEYNGIILIFSEIEKSYRLIVGQSSLSTLYDIREVF